MYSKIPLFLLFLTFAVYGQSPMQLFVKNHTKCCCGKFTAEFIKGTDCENILWQALKDDKYWEDDDKWKEFQEGISRPYGHILYCAVISSRFACMGYPPCPGQKSGCSTGSNTETIGDLDD